MERQNQTGQEKTPCLLQDNRSPFQRIAGGDLRCGFGIVHDLGPGFLPDVICQLERITDTVDRTPRPIWNGCGGLFVADRGRAK